MNQLFDRLNINNTILNIAIVSGLTSFFSFLTTLLFKFNFVYADMDQLLLWYGHLELLSGNFHGIRFIGQDYGSMLESFLSLPLSFLPVHIALPITTTVLLLVPYFLVGKYSSHKPDSWALVIGFLSVMTIEYFMMTTMPRDFVTGIFISSLSLIFIRKNSKLSLFFIGFFSLLGWAVNQNAALLGAAITLYKTFDNSGKIQWRYTLWMSLGYLSAFSIWLVWFLWDKSHPELYVHHMWKFSYQIELLQKGISKLDRHWAWISPFRNFRSWVYFVFWASIALVGWLQNKRHLIWSIGTVAILAILSLGVKKVHDGYDSIFMSYERVYFALPVITVFWLTRVRINRILTLSLLIVGCVLSLIHITKIDFKVMDYMQSGRLDRRLYGGVGVDYVYKTCQEIRQYSDSLDVNHIILGKQNKRYGINQNNVCAGLNQGLNIVVPHYERKTWMMRSLESDTIQKVLFMEFPEMRNTDGSLISFRNYQITQVFKNKCPDCYLVESDTVMALDLAKRLGYQISNH